MTSENIEMIDPEIALAIGLSALAMMLLIWLVTSLWPRVVVSISRQMLFQQRDDLFIFVKDNNISFDCPAYTQLRWSINRMIRFSHKADITSLVVMYFFTRKNRMRAEMPTLEGLAPDHAKQFLSRYHMAIKIMVSSMVFRTPAGLLFVALSPLAIFIISIVENYLQANKLPRLVEDDMDFMESKDVELAI